MKKALALIILALVATFVAPVHAQAPTPSPQSAVWTVSGTGCPAASGLPTVLSAQWATALAAVNGNAAETAMVQEWQSYTAYRISQYLAANPQQSITVRIAKPTSGGLVIVPIISTAALPAGSSCPTS